MSGNGDGQLTTQRVSGLGRGPVAVVLAALAVVALLLWKPWDQPPAATLSPPAVAARPTVSTTSSPTPSPIPTTAPVPTPTTAPSPTPTTPLVDVHVGYVIPYVWCRYAASPRGGSELVSLDVAPPRSHLNAVAAGAGIQRVSWRVELQINELDTVFSADWQTISLSRRQFSSNLATSPIAFRPKHRPYDHGVSDSPTSVVRVVVTAEWFSAGRRPLGSRSVVAASYAMDVAAARVVPEGCHVVI